MQRRKGIFMNYTELLFNLDTVSERYQSQLNGQSAQSNYNKTKNSRNKKQKKNNNILISVLQGMTAAVVKQTIDDIFNSLFKKNNF